MWTFFVLGIISTLCAIILWLLSSPFYWRNKGVPYLIPLPLFGNCLNTCRMTLMDYFKQLYKNYPNEKYFGFHFFIKPTLLLKDPELIKDIFIRDFDCFMSNGFYTNNDDPFRNNLFFLHGQAWKEIRGKLSSHFTPLKLRSVLHYVENSMKKVTEIINENLNKNESINVDKLFKNLSADIIVQSTFGVESDCFTKNSQFNAIISRTLSNVSNCKSMLGMVSPNICDFLKINIFDKEFIKFWENLLKDVFEYRKTNNIQEQDLLNALIGLVKNDQENGKVEYFPDKTVVPGYNFSTALAQALILITGGAESSAATMTFLLFEISLQQEYQDKCRQEIMDVIHETGEDIRPEDVPKLTYLDMLIKETMRKYPPFLTITRKCTKTYKLRNTNLTIEPDTLILVSTHGLMSDPKFYPEPEKFIPERFSEENKATFNPITFVPWGLGPRSCLGKNFAKLEMSLTICRILRNYKLSLSSKTRLPLTFCRYTVVTTPNSGIWLDFQPI